MSNATNIVFGLSIYSEEQLLRRSGLREVIEGEAMC